MAKATSARRRSYGLIYAALGFLLACILLRLFSSSRAGGPAPAQGESLSLITFHAQAEDGKWLGPQHGDNPPARLDDYKYTSTKYQEVYDKSWTQGGYPAQSCWGCRFGVDVATRLPFHSVLDAGTGNGALVRLMRKHGKSAWGIELSKAVLEQECPDLLKSGIVEAGILTNLPYANNSFDLVFSADVLEHVHEDEAARVVAELVRVSRRHLFLSISLKPHTKKSAEDDSEANRHTMLRPRQWWEEQFAKHGAAVNRELLWAMQEKDTGLNRKELRDCRKAGKAKDGGLYEVCVAENTWLVGRREQGNVRKDRCITTDNFELEPWFFAFRKIRNLPK